MGNKISEYKKVFEDNSLSDQQKYKKINNLFNKKVSTFNNLRCWCVVISLNVIIWPLLINIPNVEKNNSNLIPIVSLVKD